MGDDLLHGVHLGAAGPDRITLHEAAHGFVAHRLGDDTAYRLGRVTFNPLKHIDLFGTILMPAVLLLVRSPCCSATPNPCRSIFVPCAIRVATWSWWRSPGRASTSPRHSRGASLPCCCLFTFGGCKVGRAEPPQRPPYQCDPGGIQHAAAPAPRWRPGCCWLASQLLGAAVGPAEPYTA